MAKRKSVATFSGFDEIMSQFIELGGSVEEITKKCVLQAQQVMAEELKKEIKNSGIESLADRVPDPTIYNGKNYFSARVGFKVGEYNPNNISDGYKAIFLNYGTYKGEKIEGKYFVKRAKKNARQKIKKIEEETIEKVIKEIKKWKYGLN